MGDTASPLDARRALLGFAEETTSGTAVSVTTAAAGSVIFDPVIEPLDWFSEGERTPPGPSGGTHDYIPGKTLGRCTFRVEMRHDDVFHDLLAACGMSLSTTVRSFDTDFANQKTITIAVWEDGRKKILYGCAGTCVITITGGARVWAEYDFTGLWTEPVDDALPSGAIINTAPYMGEGVAFTLGGAAAPHTSTITIDLGVEVDERGDVHAANSGVAHFVVVARKPRVTVDTEARLVATNDAWGKMFAGTTEAVAITIGTGGDTLAFAAPRAQIVAMLREERAGKLIESRELALNVLSGDDELTITEA